MHRSTQPNPKAWMYDPFILSYSITTSNSEGCEIAFRNCSVFHCERFAATGAKTKWICLMSISIRCFSLCRFLLISLKPNIHPNFHNENKQRIRLGWRCKIKTIWMNVWMFIYRFSFRILQIAIILMSSTDVILSWSYYQLVEGVVTKKGELIMMKICNFSFLSKTM